MKKLLQYLGVFAIAGSLGFQTMNVEAAEACGPDEVERTNYYLFLQVNSADYYKNKFDSFEEDADRSYTGWTGAYKYNNIQKGKILEHGDVAITKGSESTVNGTVGKSWSVTEFWQKYYVALRYRDADTLEYRQDNESYLMHSSWWNYGANWTNGVEHEKSNSNIVKGKLTTYIMGNYDKLETSDLVTKGTSIPLTYIKLPEGIETSMQTSLMWNISRVFKDKDVLTGVNLEGTNYVYSPGAYYVTYCAKKEDENAKKITYNSNTTDTVVGMPANKTFSENCTNIASDTPTRSGYRFLGWSATSTSTTAEERFNAGTEYCGESITLYAIWAPAHTGPYTITYDANGGKNAPATQTGNTSGACLKISSTKPTLTGNNFLGWSRNKNAQEPDAKYASDKEYCGEEGNITLYAVWQTQTGISAHIVAFLGVALVSVVALVYAKKKNLFKQI